VTGSGRRGWQDGAVSRVVAFREWEDAVRSVTVSAVDAVMLEARASALAGRSIKRDAKRHALELAISCMDLTTLEGVDTPGKVRSLCAKALRPSPTDATVPSVAAVCVYPEMVPTAVSALAGTPVKVASVAGSFPSGLGPLPSRLDEIARAVDAGAHEIDIVLNRSALLAGDCARAFDEISASKVACGAAHLKTILETGELGSYDEIRRASVLAMAAGSDFIKTSSSTRRAPRSSTPTRPTNLDAPCACATATATLAALPPRRRTIDASMSVPTRGASAVVTTTSSTRSPIQTINGRVGTSKQLLVGSGSTRYSARNLSIRIPSDSASSRSR
jgi:deoxyribose-phosphate aldolase